MGDRDDRPSGHRPGERHHPRRGGADLRAGGCGQVDAPVARAPRSRGRLEAADHGARPPVRPVHRPPPPALTHPGSPGLSRATGRRPGRPACGMPERPGRPGRATGQQGDRHHRHDQHHPPPRPRPAAPPVRSGTNAHTCVHTHTHTHIHTHHPHADSHAAEAPRGGPALPPGARFLWTTGPWGQWPSLQRVDPGRFTGAQHRRPGAPDLAGPRPPAFRGVARRSALPVHFTRDPVRRVDFARPATGGRTAAQPPPPPGASAARSAEPDRSQDRRGKRLGTFGASGVAVTWPPRTKPSLTRPFATAEREAPSRASRDAAAWEPGVTPEEHGYGRRHDAGAA